MKDYVLDVIKSSKVNDFIPDENTADPVNKKNKASYK
jgi:hypothetical protein